MITNKSDASTMWVALSMLYMRNRDGLVPESLFFLKPDQIVTLIKTFGGQTVYIPSSEEFLLDMISATAAWHLLVECKDEDWVRDKYNSTIDHRKWPVVFKRISDWTKTLSPEELDFLKSSRNLNQ